MNISREEYLLMKRRVKRNQGQNVEYEEHKGPETDLQKECELLLYRNGIWFYHIKDARREKTGVPDIIFPNPFDDGKFYAVELKTKEGKQSPEQQVNIRQIQANKAKAFICRSLEQFRDILMKGGEHDKSRNGVL